jgi:deoxycytidine triphosphate deaminase
MESAVHEYTKFIKNSSFVTKFPLTPHEIKVIVFEKGKEDFMLTNAEIEEARKNGDIRIENYDPDNLGMFFYILTPAKVFKGPKKTDDGTLVDIPLPLKDLKSYPCPINSGENVIIVFKERIILSKKYYGSLFSCSDCIEPGLYLTFGKISPEYDSELRIGITNLGVAEYVLRTDSELVKVGFEKFSENARFLPLSVKRKEHDKYIEQLRREKAELTQLMRNTSVKVKEIDERIDKEDQRKDL